jgi:hypothetical protein
LGEQSPSGNETVIGIYEVSHPKFGAKTKGAAVKSKPPLAFPPLSRYFPPAVAKVYIVSFRSHNNDRPSRFIVLASSMKSAIKIAWKHGGADFQSRFDKSTQAEQMKEGVLRVR